MALQPIGLVFDPQGGFRPGLWSSRSHARRTETLLPFSLSDTSFPSSSWSYMDARIVREYWSIRWARPDGFLYGDALRYRPNRLASQTDTDHIAQFVQLLRPKTPAAPIVRPDHSDANQRTPSG